MFKDELNPSELIGVHEVQAHTSRDHNRFTRPPSAAQVRSRNAHSIVIIIFIFIVIIVLRKNFLCFVAVRTSRLYAVITCRDNLKDFMLLRAHLKAAH